MLELVDVEPVVLLQVELIKQQIPMQQITMQKQGSQLEEKRIQTLQLQVIELTRSVIQLKSRLLVVQAGFVSVNSPWNPSNTFELSAWSNSAPFSLDADLLPKDEDI